MKSGWLYQFRYSAWRNDPYPTVLFLNSFSGYHPNTGHEWRFIQCINLNYIPRYHRTQFARIWKNEMRKNNGKVEITWDRVTSEFPYLKHAIRRYFYKPNYYITNMKEIPIDQIEEAVVSTWSKDFSKKLRLDLAKKFRRAQGRRRRTGGFMSNFIKDIFGG